MNLNEFIAVAPSWHRAGISLEILSGPGAGKTSSVYQIAANLSVAYKAPFGVTSHILSSMEAPDARGYLMPIKENGRLLTRFTRPTIFPNEWNVEVFVDGKKLPHEARSQHIETHGIPKYGIVFFDEFGQSEQDVQKPMGTVLLDKAMGEYDLNELGTWSVWAASNRMRDRSGVVKPLMFLMNRRMVINIEPCVETWKQWANKNGVHPVTVAFATKFPQHVFRDTVPSEDGPYCTPRSLVLCSQTLEAMRREGDRYEQLPHDSLAQQVMSGWLGEGVAADYVTHVRLVDELPDIKDVIKDPEGCRVPKRADAQFVMVSMLPHYTKKEVLGKLLTYIGRFPEDLQAVYVNTLFDRDPAGLAVPEMTRWLQKNATLLQAASAATRG